MADGMMIVLLIVLTVVVVVVVFVTPHIRYMLGTYDTAGQSRVLQSDNILYFFMDYII